MLEQPNLVEEENKIPDLSKLEAKELTNEEKIVIQAYINFLFVSLPDKDE